jgi:small subunit ribosomal protein S1
MTDKLTSYGIDEDYWSALLREDHYPHSEDLTNHDEIIPFKKDNALVSHYDDLHPSTTREDWDAIEEITQNDLTVSLPVIGYNRGGLLVEYHSLRGFVPSSQITDFPASGNVLTRRAALSQKVGTTLNLRVIELNIAKNRLILSERAAQAQPGGRQDLLNTIKAGDTIEGVVSNICEFGVFVDLGGLEGLIHISELSWGRVSRPENVLKWGEVVRTHVLSVDRSAGRVALSLKRLHPDPWQSVQDKYHLGQMIEGKISNVVDFGAFVCVADGLEGLIHVSELAEGQFLHPRNVVSEGEHVQARVIAIDSEARRLGLSLRLTY